MLTENPQVAGLRNRERQRLWNRILVRQCFRAFRYADFGQSSSSAVSSKPVPASVSVSARISCKQRG
jgi:hypothetical protein